MPRALFFAATQSTHHRTCAAYRYCLQCFLFLGLLLLLLVRASLGGYTEPDAVSVLLLEPWLLPGFLAAGFVSIFAPLGIRFMEGLFDKTFGLTFFLLLSGSE